MCGGVQIITFWRLCEGDYKAIEVYKDKLFNHNGFEISDDIIIEVIEQLYKNYKVILR